MLKPLGAEASVREFAEEEQQQPRYAESANEAKQQYAAALCVWRDLRGVRVRWEGEGEGGLAALTLSEKSLPSWPGEIESYLRACVHRGGMHIHGRCIARGTLHRLYVADCTTGD